MEQTISIIKSSGETAPFSEKKLRNSLFKAGADDSLIQQIIQTIRQELYNGISTKEIYKRSFQLLRKNAKHLAAKYKLKKAILELGPSGYPFERYLGKLFIHQGFEVKVGQAVEGHCITHEVDVMATNTDTEWIVECKHHSTPSYKSDVKVPLYVHARFNDIITKRKKLDSYKKIRFQCCVATNTRFTTDAIAYAGCYQIQLISWDYPKRGNLKERIDLSGLYPITCLCTLTRSEKKRLLDRSIVLCKELIQTPQLLEEINIPAHKIRKVLAESKSLCAPAN